MEEEALAKLQKDKKTTVLAPSSSAASLSKLPLSKASSAPPQPSETRAEKDLIVFPETRTPVDQDQFRDIDVDKLTNEELEKLLLDENFGTRSSVSRPSSLLGFNLSASYPGGHVSPFQSAQWGSVLSTPSSSSLSTPTHQPTPMFPPAAFQNGFAPAVPPFIALAGQQPPFVTFTPIQPAPAAIVYPQQAVDPQMAKLFHKIASTSEYLKNGKSSGGEQEPSPASLAPNPPPRQPAQGAESAGTSRFDWLDLDPLTKRKADSEEPPPVGVDGPTPEPAGVDPWEAVLESKDAGSCSPSPDAKARSQHRRSSMGAAVARTYSPSTPASSSKPLKAQLQVGGALPWLRLSRGVSD